MKSKRTDKTGHIFTLMVNNGGTRKSAEIAVLSAFAQRKPDGCEFCLSKKDAQKVAFKAGFDDGLELGFGLALRSIENQMEGLKVKRLPTRKL